MHPMVSDRHHPTYRFPWGKMGKPCGVTSPCGAISCGRRADPDRRAEKKCPTIYFAQAEVSIMNGVGSTGHSLEATMQTRKKCLFRRKSELLA